MNGLFQIQKEQGGCWSWTFNPFNHHPDKFQWDIFYMQMIEYNSPEDLQPFSFIILPEAALLEHQYLYICTWTSSISGKDTIAQSKLYCLEEKALIWYAFIFAIITVTGIVRIYTMVSIFHFPLVSPVISCMLLHMDQHLTKWLIKI